MVDSLNVLCPCCGNKLVVDGASGEVLSEERPRQQASKSFEQAMTDVQHGTRRREEAFSKAFEKTRHQEDLIEKKFEEARKKAAEDKTPLRKPFDDY